MAAWRVFAQIDVAPLTRFELPDFVGSGKCAFCHSDLQDAAANDVSIDSHWRSTMMANSAKDPLWQAKVVSETARNPALAAVIEDKCATCHMPMARAEAKMLGSPSGITGTGFLNPTNGYHAAAMDGVSCSLCHQIQDHDLGETESFSGHYTIDTSTQPPNRLIYGPFPKPFQRQMQNNLGFTPIHGPHVSESALCGVCHNLYTPFVDGQGTIQGEFPEQMVYSEWEHSAYSSDLPQARSCQDCHMPDAMGGVRLSNRGGPGMNLQLRSPFGQHMFVGGNAFMLGMLSSNLTELGVTATPAQIVATLNRTMAQLQQQTARLSVPLVRISPEDLLVTLRVQNLAGHKLPTGFPSRRVWLHFKVTDSNGAVVFESGQPQSDGRIAGNDNDADRLTCEPHYEVISQQEQVQIYEAVMENSDGEITYTLLRGAAYRKDNRLLPLGFDKTSASGDIAPWGAATRDQTFTGGDDEITYRIPTGDQKGPFTVRAELLYQTLGHAFAADLFQDEGEEIDHFERLHKAANKLPVTLASSQLLVDPSAVYTLESLAQLPDGSVGLIIEGPVGGESLLQFSTNFSSWFPLITVIHSNNPTIYVDDSATNQPQRFYRLTAP